MDPFEAIAQGMTQAVPFAGHLGLEITQVAAGESTVVLPDRHPQHAGLHEFLDEGELPGLDGEDVDLVAPGERFEDQTKLNNGAAHAFLHDCPVSPASGFALAVDTPRFSTDIRRLDADPVLRAAAGSRALAACRG